MKQTNNSLEFFTTQKVHITKQIHETLTTQKNSFKKDVMWVDDSYERLEKFVQNGKMIRGGLFLLSATMFGGTLTQSHLMIAAGLEFFHSALLIHDDIMDNDTLRRGQPTIFAQYEILAKKRKIKNPAEYGKSMALTLGDLSFFLAYELFAKAELPTEIYSTFLAYFSKDAAHVGLGQMQDFSSGKEGIEPTEAEIMSVYKYKTARYTFSLPLVLGAIVTKQSQKVIDSLEAFGEDAGMIFQIRDDELRYFSTEAEIGKSIGSDVMENTKTIFRLSLYQKSSTKEKQKLNTIFGNRSASEHDLQYVRDQLGQKGILQDMQIILTHYKANALRNLAGIGIDDTYKLLLTDLIDYIYMRKK